MNRPQTVANDAARYMTAKQVGKRFACSERTIYRWADTGKMPPPVKIGGAVRFKIEAIDEWEADGFPHHRNASR
ncbi:helix-turn-helix transcriptional regulator [Rhodopirellula sallentina]|uniref:Prophage CP4-57 regulatory n=1 Tax=Rhodopirellula sallentina SM41 TaxID=1263870 RepID=M5UJU7_9BACT|nr:helix-turn-helix domain-containing protein [Rhodopirellula sallentina]EMI58131.1 Prophage CP4-57 regulatory [Rhodopirellula sallentina SM41]